MADEFDYTGNVDPRARFADAPQPKKGWITLVPVDHDPWARFQDAPQPDDGGDLSGPSARRLPGEQAVAPHGTVLQGPGELEDPEAAAFTPRTGYEHIPFANAAIGMAGLTQAPFKAARDMVHGAAESVERLGQQGYHPEIDDEQYKRQAAADAFNAAGLTGTGGFAGSAAVADAGSLGVFIGRTGAENMAKAGRPTALKALDMAERMDAKGIPEKSIREATNALIEAEDARLGGVHKGEDGMWRLELDDSQARFRQAGPQTSRLGRELKYPDLYDAHPDLTQRRLDRYSSKDSYYFPDDDSFLIGEGAASRKKAALHEVEHAVAKRNDLAAGAAPEDFADGGPGAHLRLPGETPTQAYNRVLGEQYAGAVEARWDYDAAKRRRIPPQVSIEKRRQGLGLEDKTIFVTEHGRAQSNGRDPLAPDEPPAFEQAQEQKWEDLAQRGEVGQQPMWSDMGAHLNKPGQRGGGPGKAPSDLWSREVNLDLAQMHRSGEWPADISARLSDKFGKRYSEDQVAGQLEALGLIGSSRKLPGSAVGEWQPDAMAILQSDRVNGMPAAQIAKLIEQETGQVTTKNAVIGKLNRLRQEGQRAELSEDLANSGIKLRATGVPVPIRDAERRRRAWPIWDRINFWGGY